MPKLNHFDKVFEERYKTLNKDQKQAVDTIEGPVMVIAGPGTGKTTILTLRIANILKTTDTPPGGILALTFTDAGVKAMKTSLRRVIGSRADEVRIHTFHGFAGSIIAEFPEHFTHIYRAKQLADVEVESILRDILNNKKYSPLRPVGDRDYYLGKIINAIHESKKEGFTPEKLRLYIKEEIENINTNESFRSSRGPTKGELKADAKKRLERCDKTILLAGVWEEYEAKKRELRKIDFDDLLFELYKAIKNDELLLQLIQEKFLYVLLDEHQDTNDLQNEIVSLVMNFFDTPNLFVVGDEKQAIYRFQGASVENFLKFQQLWKNMKIIKLVENYRSHQVILDAAFSMIENNYNEGEHTDLRVELVSKAGKDNKPIDLVETKSVSEQDAYLVEKIKDILEHSPGKNIAVIVRKNKEVDHILSLCENAGIDARAERGGDLFSHSVGVAFFSILDYINDQTKLESLASTITIGMWRLTFEDRIRILRQIKSGGISSLDKEIPNLKDIEKQILSLGPIEYLIYLAEISGMLEIISQKPFSVEVWRGIISLATDIANSRNIFDAKTLISALLDYKLSADKRVVKVPGGVASSLVEITTAHGSKGLEYDYVFIPYATDESWVGKNHGAGFVLPNEKGEGDEVKDSRRLFYVAMTRAKSHVHIVIPLMDTDGKIFTKVRFSEEINESFINKIGFDKKLPFSFGTYSNLQDRDRNEVLNYAKSIILEKGISVTAVNHYYNCPNEFLYKSILKLPEPPSPSSEKGIAMHKAMALCWSLKNKEIETIQETIDNTAERYIKESLLTKTDKEIVLEEIHKDSLSVAKSLHAHFNQEGRVSVESWVEKELEVVYKNENISLNLHGQLDAVLEQVETIFVYDYKTKKFMSENAIKGETKNEDGNYWRQLVFYKMLLEGSHKFKAKKIQPSLWFIKPDNGMCKEAVLDIEDKDIKKLEEELDFLIQDVWSGKFLDRSCADSKCKYCAMKNI